MLGVIVLAVTSGDTAMRSCRLMMADLVHLPQRSIVSRLALALPLFVLVFIISKLDFSVIWRYFGWANQMLACLTLWCISLYLRKRNRFYWISLPPALLMTTVCVSYLLHSSECGIGMNVQLATTLGLCFSSALLVLFLVFRKKTA